MTVPGDNGLERHSHFVSIEGGENAGQRILYSNIVASWDTVASWDGATAVELRYEGLDGAATPENRS